MKICFLFNFEIFAGRQDYEFASLKTIYIKRTARFAKDIADYLRRKYTYVWVPIFDWASVLNYILNGEDAPVNNNELIKGYYQAHYLGLRFLADLARETILERLGDPNVVIEALQAADSVNDELLLGKAAQVFHNWREAILKSQKWYKTFKDSTIQCHFIAHSVRRLVERGTSCYHCFQKTFLI